MTLPRPALFVALCAALVSASIRVSAQTAAPAAPAPAPTAPPATTAAPVPPDGPPRITTAPEPQLPAEAFEGKTEASIAIELLVDETGAVLDVVVLEPASGRLDPLVVEAARSFRFEPAVQGGQRIASRVRLRLRLAPSAPPPPTEPAAGTAPPAATGQAVVEGDIVSEEEPTYETVVRGEVYAPDQVRRSLTVDEISHIPGTGGDALRSIQAMPGVARAPGGSGLIIVRGSAPTDTKTSVDGVIVPFLYHFGGLTSVLPTAMLEGIDFFPGNFGARYGNATGGIVEARTRRAKTDRFHLALDVDLIDAGLLAEGPIGDDLGVMVGVRRSYIDAFIGLFAEDLGFDLVSAPVYYDYQLLLDYTPSDDDRLRAFFFGSDDRFEIILDEPLDFDPAFRGNVVNYSHFDRLQLRYDREMGGGMKLHTSVTPSYTEALFSLGEALSFEGQFPALQARAELTIPVGRRDVLRGGGDLVLGTYDIRARLPEVPKEGEPPRPISSQRIVTARTTETYFLSGVFAEYEWRPAQPLTFVPALRLEAYEPGGAALTPRLTARYAINEPTTLKAGIGMFAQAPQADELDPVFGTPDLGPEKALHASVGVERRLARRLTAGVEVFGKSLWDLVRRVDAPELPRGFDYENGGTGRVYGLETLVRLESGGPLYGWIAYTLLRSERRDAPGEEYRLFDFDQTHILNVVAGLLVRGGWRFGVRFRYVTGNPDSPILAALYDSDADVYVPVYGPLNSARLQPFHQLDVRIDKEWALGPVKGSVYLDVQNAYNRANPEGFFYNYDYTERSSVSGLPLLPSLGFEATY